MPRSELTFGMVGHRLDFEDFRLESKRRVVKCLECGHNQLVQQDSAEESVIIT